MSVLAEVKRRKIFQVAVVYAVVAWLLIQIASTVESPLQLPAWFDTAIIVLLLIGFPITMIFAWVYEFSAGGLRRTPRAETLEEAEPSRSERPREEGGAVAGPAVLPNSIAVLPFENMSPNPDHAYFAAGIHEEILNSLAKLKSLSVIARTSVLQYAGTQKLIGDIAGALGVETIMEGSVRYAGDRVRVTTQLIDAGTGAHLWSEAYERQFDDIFAIQADIAVQVAKALEAEFSSEEQRLVESPATTSSEAYSLYLKSLSLDSDPGIVAEQIHALLDRAIALDPRFSLALGAKAEVCAMELINTTANVARDPKDLEPLIHKYAAAALEIDPRDANAHVALCILAEFTWRWAEARAHALRAADSAPWGVIVATVNWTMSWSGDADLAIATAERLQRLNPSDWSGAWNLGLVLNYAGRYDAAAAALRESIAMLPALPIQHSWLAVTEIARGDLASARRELELAEKLVEGERQIIYLLDWGYAYGRLGNKDNARRLYDELRSTAAGQDIGAGGWALAHMAIGDYDEALRWLRVAADKAARHEIDAGMFSLMNLKQNFTADPVLEQPEFVEVRARLKGD
jgi:adenylate cyclase